MQIANINQAKTKLSELIRRAIAGEEVYIARADEPLVRLEPIARDTRPRIGGQWKGKLWMASDIEAPNPELDASFYDAPLAQLADLGK